jgi:hypothetical protein
LVSGVSEMVWDSDGNLALSFQQAVAVVCGNGLLYSAVSITSVSSYSPSAHAFPQRGAAMKLLSTDTLQIAYTINQAIVGYDSSSQALKNVSIALKEGVSNGYLSAYMQAFATSNGVSSSVVSGITASSTGLVVSSTAQPTTYPTSPPASVSGHHLSIEDTSVIIIVVVVVGVVIVASCGAVSLWWGRNGRCRVSPPAQDSAPAAVTLGNIRPAQVATADAAVISSQARIVSVVEPDTPEIRGELV